MPIDAVAARTKEVEEWDQWAMPGRSRGLRLKPWLRLPIAESTSVQSATAEVGYPQSRLEKATEEFSRMECR